MPELPEAERIRRILEAHLPGLLVEDVHVRRADVVRDSGMYSSRREGLLHGGRFLAMHRHGKRLALEVEDGRVLEIGLGMTGQLLLEKNGRPTGKLSHRHVYWRLRYRNGSPAGRLVWRDPRRFGGLTPLTSIRTLHKEYWRRLGPDALEISLHELQTRLDKTKRAVKTTLLDQQVIAGIGNIYADEGLHRAKIDPRTPSARLGAQEIRSLHRVIKTLLSQATEAGGSTIRDFIDPMVGEGSFQASHAVYGRSGASCHTCGTTIESCSLGGRTTNWCPCCQH